MLFKKFSILKKYYKELLSQDYTLASKEYILSAIYPGEFFIIIALIFFSKFVNVKGFALGFNGQYLLTFYYAILFLHFFYQSVYELNGEGRLYLHLAAVFACNFSNHMYSLCDQILAAHKIPFDVMLPLIDETARKVHQMPPLQAQTGPAVRHDENVIQHHLDLLEDGGMKDIYRLLSKDIYDRLQSEEN